MVCTEFYVGRIQYKDTDSNDLILKLCNWRDFWLSNKITHNLSRSLQQPLNLSLFFFNVSRSPIQDSRDIATQTLAIFHSLYTIKCTGNLSTPLVVICIGIYSHWYDFTQITCILTETYMLVSYI